MYIHKFSERGESEFLAMFRFRYETRLLLLKEDGNSVVLSPAIENGLSISSAQNRPNARP